MTIGLTSKQSGLLEFIATFTEQEGMPPTLAELRRFTGAKSPTAPLDSLKSLERKGYLKRRPRISRGTTLTDKARTYLKELAARRQLA